MTSRDLLLQRFLKELPRLASAEDLALSTSPVRPWPHQVRVVRRLVERFPESYLLSDEVGLGKTIEAALTLRQLMISGRARRALVLAPRAVLKQWQEELREKAALDAALFDGERFLGPRGGSLSGGRGGNAGNPWNRHDLVLASSQLARSSARRPELLAARPWDVVIVDEAHHARRRGWPGPYRPNRLLELLAGSPGGAPGLVSRSRALYLLSATPMQLHPVELWDLLRLLGLGGAWGASARAFLGYFEQLRLPWSQRDWPSVLGLAEEAQRLAGPRLEEPPSGVRRLLEAREDGDARRRALEGLDADERQRGDGWLRRATPVSLYVWRHTRPLLRRYREQGLLEAGVPERRPRNVWIAMSADQRRLYRRIENYLIDFYQRYEARRAGLGFVMTVLRRRLTSSFGAIERSLERRRRRLLGEAPPDGATPWGLAAEDAAAEELGQQADLFEVPEAPDAAEGGAESVVFEDELGLLDSLLEQLAAAGEEPKLGRLEKDLRRMLRRRDRALVFTQYLDTLDPLRERLRAAGWKVACYSGRGGERWREGAWRSWGKESLKEAFARGEIDVLLCTEAASEGLNLQTCGILINYDMPWNPMRVEQRIGRIDRIGQQHPTVWIRNYFYRDSVEAEIYRRLAGRIDWFREVVGELQPILHRVGEALESLAMTPQQRRRRRLEERLRELEAQLGDRPPPVIVERSSERQGVPEIEPPRAPASPRRLERLMTSPSWPTGGLEATEEDGVFRLGDRRVTFRPRLYARLPYSLSLLTWGVPLFERLLEPPAHADPAGDSEEPAGVGLYSSRSPAPVSVFAAPRGEETLEVTTLEELEGLFGEVPGTWTGDQEARAASLFSRRRRRVLEGLRQVEGGRRRAERQTLRSAAADLLVQAAGAQQIAAENPGLFDRPQSHGWGRAPIEAQARRSGTFARLVALVPADLELRRGDPRLEELSRRPPADLTGRLDSEARELVRRWRALEDAEEADRRPLSGVGGDVSVGLLERTYFALEPRAGSLAARAEETAPLDNEVPLWPSPGAAAREIAAALAEGLGPAAACAAASDSCGWLRLEDRLAASPGLFAARLVGRALEPRHAQGCVGLFRIDTSPPRPGQLVLVDGVEDPETGEGAALRRWRLERRRGTLCLVLEALAPGVVPIVLEDPEEDVRVLARLIDSRAPEE
ncbi:MAG: helicase-related protein [Acidobacteriota bacterium]